MADYDPNSSEESPWIEAIVGRLNGNFLFPTPFKMGFSCILMQHDNKCSARLGDFVQIKIRKNLDARPDQKAQHIVRDIKLIDPPEGIINVTVSEEAALVKIRARFEKVVSFARGKAILLRHPDLGCVVDYKRIIPVEKFVAGSDVLVTIKVTASPLDKFQSIFSVMEYHGLGEPIPMSNKQPNLCHSKELRTSGFVEGHNNATYYIWLKELDDSIPCSWNVNELFGKWVDITLRFERDGKPFFYSAPVLSKNQATPVRIHKNSAEVQVNCSFKGEVEFDGSHIFSSDLLGNICDINKKASTCRYLAPQQGRPYIVWASRLVNSKHRSRWKISSIEASRDSDATSQQMDELTRKRNLFKAFADDGGQYTDDEEDAEPSENSFTSIKQAEKPTFNEVVKPSSREWNENDSESYPSRPESAYSTMSSVPPEGESLNASGKETNFPIELKTATLEQLVEIALDRQNTRRAIQRNKSNFLALTNYMFSLQL